MGLFDIDQTLRDLRNFSSQEIQRALDRAANNFDDSLANEDGAGPHGGAGEPTLDDQIVWRAAYLAVIGTGNGIFGRNPLYLPNASRHLKHYLENSGKHLELNVSSLMSVPKVTLQLNSIRDRVMQRARTGSQTTNYAFGELEVSQSDTNNTADNIYIFPKNSADWFYAMAGHSRRYLAFIYPCERRVELTFKWKDNYNWDGKKQVTIQGFTVSDKVLGRLHQVGIAKEFPMSGEHTEVRRY